MSDPKEYDIIPLTRQYRPKSGKPNFPVPQKCDKHSKKSVYYPVFHVGLSLPFYVLVGLCEECAKEATAANTLTDERWKRMRAILKENGERMPQRKAVKMSLEKTIWKQLPRDLANSYSYAMAA